MKKINYLSKEKIRNNLDSFEYGFSGEKDEGRKPWARYASFDYCFNYFQKPKNKKELIKNMQNSCLHIAFYLASWGMLRGSSFLLNKSIKYYEELIRYISKKEKDFWSIDVSSYSEKNIEKLIECGDEIRSILNNNEKNKVSDTLITKIMLGVFGNVPAFDTYFLKGSGLGKFNEHALQQITDFYKSNEKIISNKARKTKTFEYSSGVEGSRVYTEAKIIDMIFFAEGIKI